MAVTSAAAGRKPYTYKKLNDLQLGGGAVHLIGVAVLFKPPYQSKGRDYTCTVEIVDESSRASAVPLIFFNRDVKKLPQNVNVGDVVCVRRVELGEFNDRIQGKCRNYCSWLVWKSGQQGHGGGRQRGGGGGGGGRVPSLSSEGASWDSSELTRADQLLAWSTGRAGADLQQAADTTSTNQPGPSSIKSPLAGTSSSSLLPPICDIVRVNHKISVMGVVKEVSLPQKSRGPDFFISVVLIDETSPNEGFPITLFSPIQSQLPVVGEPGCVAYVMNIKVTEYDEALMGCGHERSKVVCFTLDSDGEMVSNSGGGGGGGLDFPNSVIQRAEFLLEWVATAKPALTTVELSQLTQDMQPHPTPLTHPHPHSSSSTPPPPLTHPHPHPHSSSSAPPPPPTTTTTTAVLSSTGDDSELVYRPPTFLTVMFHPTWPVSTLREIDTFPRVPSRFRTRVKVLQVISPRLEECCQLRCPKCKHRPSPPPTSPSSEDTDRANSVRECERCSSEEDPVNLKYMYCLSLLVRDSSGVRTLVHLSDSNAEEFFQNLPPGNLRENPSFKKSLLKVLTLLCGGKKDPFEDSPDPSTTSQLSKDKLCPWIDCCVQSYSSSSKGTQLRIVDTWFVDSLS